MNLRKVTISMDIWTRLTKDQIEESTVQVLCADRGHDMEGTFACAIHKATSVSVVEGEEVVA